MYIDAALLWFAIRDEQSFRAAKDLGVRSDLLIDPHKAAWRFVCDYYQRHRLLPSAAIITEATSAPVAPPDEADRVALPYVVKLLHERHEFWILSKGLADTYEKFEQGDQKASIQQVLAIASGLTKAAIERRESAPHAWDGLLDRLQVNWGRSCLGFEVPSLPGLSIQTAGVSGLVLLSAEPGIGKSTLANSILGEVLEADTDTVGVYVSRELTAEHIGTDYLARWAGYNSRQIYLGLQLQDSNMFHPVDPKGFRDQLQAAQERLLRLKDRLVVLPYDRPEGKRPTVRGVWEEVQRIQDRTGAAHVFAVVDSLNKWPVNPKLTDLQADARRIDDMLELKEKVAPDPLARGALMVIAEARKGSGREWTVGVQDVKGSVTATYTPDQVWLLGHAVRATGRSEKQAEAAERRRSELAEKGRTLLRLWIRKCRKPGRSGVSVPLTFDFAKCSVTEGHDPADLNSSDDVRGEADGHRKVPLEDDEDCLY